MATSAVSSCTSIPLLQAVLTSSQRSHVPIPHRERLRTSLVDLGHLHPRRQRRLRLHPRSPKLDVSSSRPRLKSSSRNSIIILLRDLGVTGWRTLLFGSLALFVHYLLAMESLQIPSSSPRVSENSPIRTSSSFVSERGRLMQRVSYRPWTAGLLAHCGEQISL